MPHNPGIPSAKKWMGVDAWMVPGHKPLLYTVIGNDIMVTKANYYGRSMENHSNLMNALVTL